MQCKHAFVGVCPEEKNMKKKKIDEKIEIETKLTNNAFPVVTPLQHCTYSGLLGTIGLLFRTPWDWWGMKYLVLGLMNDWNRVWSTPEENGKSADVRWYITTTSSDWVCSSQTWFNTLDILSYLLYFSSLLSGAVHTRVEVHRMDSEMSGLVERPWLQIMCCAICLLHGYNFRWKRGSLSGSEYWLVYRRWTLEIEFNESLSLLIIRLANYNVTTSFIYKLIV